MRELEVVLAVALSFLIFSTVASMVLEVFYRHKKIRLKGLKIMLNEFYETELINLHKPSPNYPLKNDTQFSQHVLKLNKDNHALSAVQFIERLATSNFAKRIANNAKTDVALLINDIVRKYDEYGKATTFTFKQNAEKDNLILAVIIALVLNINVITLTKTFLDNRGLTESLIAQSETLLAQAEVQQRKLEQSNQQSEENKIEFMHSITRLNQAVGNIKGLELPIGWSRGVLQYFEDNAAKLFCDAPGSSDFLEQYAVTVKPYHYCKNDIDVILFWISTSLAWLISTILTGLLIGLGGPFWFDVVKRINIFRNVIGHITTPQKNSKSDVKNQSQALEIDYPSLFENAYKANALQSSISSNKLPLAPSNIRLGRIIKN